MKHSVQEYDTFLHESSSSGIKIVHSVTKNRSTIIILTANDRMW